MPKQTKEQVLKDAKEFCDLNGLQFDDFLTDIMYKGLMIAKYGDYMPEKEIEEAKPVEAMTYIVPEDFLSTPKEAVTEPLVEKPVEETATKPKRAPKRKITVK